LLKHAVECAFSNLIIQIAGNRDEAFSASVLILPVASLCNEQVPTIGFNELDRITDFHKSILAQLLFEKLNHLANKKN
jgi:hypothetical protein